MTDDVSTSVTKVPFGRRLFLGLVTVGAVGVAFGGQAQKFIGQRLGSGFASLLPGGDHFRIYTISGGYPAISTTKYQLKVSGLVDAPMTFSFADLRSLPAISFVKGFQCVTG